MRGGEHKINASAVDSQVPHILIHSQQKGIPALREASVKVTKVIQRDLCTKTDFTDHSLDLKGRPSTLQSHKQEHGVIILFLTRAA